jgi:DNA-binding protein
MIKHNSASSAISPFNPIVSLNPKVRKRVNDEFIHPIISQFFSDKGGVNSFVELDSDKLKTDIEFKEELNFVKTYIYKELMNAISKGIDGKVNFKPRYLISFDTDLTDYEVSGKNYPNSSKRIKYGVIRLGKKPILYYIYLDLQELISFIKKLPIEVEIVENEKFVETAESIRNRLMDELVAKQHRKFISAINADEKEREKEELKRLMALSKQTLQGESGKLRVNLSWNTTDDLDLHIDIEGGRKINYNNKTEEYNGSIGTLDIDANTGGNIVSNPQENVNWYIIPMGKHTVSVDLFSDREKRNEIPFTIFIENGEDSRVYNSFVKNEGIHKTKKVVEFESNNGVIVFRELIY